jgi:hypothetical protein
MTALQKLALLDAPLLGIRPQELLDVLPRLQQLTELNLYEAMFDGAPAAQYSALVSSSKLEILELTGSFLQGCWWAIFGGRRQLPALRILDLNDWTVSDDHSLCTHDLRNIASSCPGLQELFLWHCLDRAADVSVLQPLQHLTRLFTTNIMVSTEAAAGLTRLASLKLLQVHSTQGCVLVFADEEGMLRRLERGRVGWQVYFTSDVSDNRGVWE